MVAVQTLRTLVRWIELASWTRPCGRAGSSAFTIVMIK